MWKNQLLFIIVGAACISFVEGQNMDLPAILQAACLNECRPDRPEAIHGDGSCYIKHPSDCFKFVICIPMSRFGAMSTQVMSCAFGTMWNETDNVCQRSDLVRCGNDPCKNTTVTMHKTDINCRTYWKCTDGFSEPDCCPRYRRFNPVTKSCDIDLTCDASCPLLNDATCTGPGVRSLDYGDENCKTYFNCVDGQPIPTCCPDGYGYDPLEANCTLDQSCIKPCPLDNKDNCKDPTVQAYALMNDTNCRTYIMCNSEGKGEPFCCRSTMEFDENLQQCVDARTLECINTQCPLGYGEECRMEAVLNEPLMYKNLDVFGGTIMPCPVGTMFFQERCQCDNIPTTPGTRVIGVCREEIHAIMPSLRNNGSVVAALLMIGKYGQGEKGVGNITAYWDGDDGINIPYFGSQAPSKLYIEINFKPTGNTPGKQVLLSSCKYIDNKVSLEISLMSDQNNAGTLTTILGSQGVGLSRNFTIPYKVREQYNFKLIYDGRDFGAILTPSTEPPVLRSGSLSGNIPIHISGLRLTKCRYERGVSGFIGYVSEIKISKCLKPSMTTELEEILRATNTQPGP